MKIYRAEHQNNYLLVTNDLARDGRLSLAARGLLVFLLSNTDGWTCSTRGLKASTGLSEHTITKLLKELQAAGYLKITKTRTTSGQFETQEWALFEDPRHDAKNRDAKKCNTEPAVLHKTETRKNRDAVNRDAEKCNTLRNTNSKKYQIKEIPKVKEVQIAHEEEKITWGEFNHVLLTLTENRKLREKIGDTETNRLIYDLDRYLENHPRKKYKSHYATILTWNAKDSRQASAAQKKTSGLGLLERIANGEEVI